VGGAALGAFPGVADAAGLASAVGGEESAQGLLEYLPPALAAVLPPGFLEAFSLIILSELGDKTFFVAGLYAMKTNKLISFAGSLGALGVMTFIAVAIGQVLRRARAPARPAPRARAALTLEPLFQDLPQHPRPRAAPGATPWIHCHPAAPVRRAATRAARRRARPGAAALVGARGAGMRCADTAGVVRARALPPSSGRGARVCVVLIQPVVHLVRGEGRDLSG
jgi:hypothetical protein